MDARRPRDQLGLGPRLEHDARRAVDGDVTIERERPVALQSPFVHRRLLRPGEAGFARMRPSRFSRRDTRCLVNVQLRADGIRAIHRLYSRKWVTAVSLAGPASNLVLALLMGTFLRFAPVSPSGIWPALAFLAVLQVTAALFNLIPVPPFDGYGALRPHLSLAVQERMNNFAQVSMLVVFAVFWYVPFVGGLFWGLVFSISKLIGIPLELVGLGQQLFMFWR